MNRISRFATSVVVAGGVGLSGLGMATANAQGAFVGLERLPPRLVLELRWHRRRHQQHHVPVVRHTSSRGAPGVALAPPPAQLPPGTPFGSPRGSLIIIPPICDEIGVDLLPGSVSGR